MSYILGIDTSSTELGLGLADERHVIMSVSRFLPNAHAEHISRGIDFLFETTGLKPSDISHAAIAIGPGSFTGLRIGISFLKGFCFGRDVKVLPVSSLESFAYSWNNREMPIVVGCDGRNNEVFHARFEPEGGRLLRKSEDRLMPLQEFSGAIAEGDIVITDTLGYANSTIFSFLKGRRNCYAVEDYPVQRGLACARLAMRALEDPVPWKSAACIQPKYLNVTAAEKKMAGRLKN